MVSERSVNLSHVACERSGTVQTASTYRRLQRFFQHVRLDEDWALPLLIRLLGLKGSWLIALDRTNWQIGKTEVNYLVLALLHHVSECLWYAMPAIYERLEEAGYFYSIRLPANAVLRKRIAHRMTRPVGRPSL